jgi:hypothetical protein
MWLNYNKISEWTVILLQLFSHLGACLIATWRGVVGMHVHHNCNRWLVNARKLKRVSFGITEYLIFWHGNGLPLTFWYVFIQKVHLRLWSQPCYFVKRKNNSAPTTDSRVTVLCCDTDNRIRLLWICRNCSCIFVSWDCCCNQTCSTNFVALQNKLWGSQEARIQCCS